jgi:ribonuclease BN (tRNA processing enzyme)
MNIQILGAHNIESKESRCISILIDGILAVDAGALTSSLSLEAQQKLRAVLLTHQHYDHVRDVPALGINNYLFESTIDIYAPRLVLKALSAHLINDVLYPDYTKKPPEKPAIRFRMMEAGKEELIAGYTVLPLPVKHAVPTVGYLITAENGKKLFYTSDTGPGLEEVWKKIAPDLLITEVTGINKYQDFALESGHLTPAQLQKELESFREIKRYLPQIILVHMNPIDERRIKAEISGVEKALKTKISFGYEGMQIKL